MCAVGLVVVDVKPAQMLAQAEVAEAAAGAGAVRHGPRLGGAVGRDPRPQDQVCDGGNG